MIEINLLPGSGKKSKRGGGGGGADLGAAFKSFAAKVTDPFLLAAVASAVLGQNIFIGAELTRTLLPGIAVLDKVKMRADARRYLSGLNVAIDDTNRAVDTLSGGQRQAVAIARALRWNARLVIMDEPTAALGVAESRQVLDLISELHRAGTTVILISHNMTEVVQVATRVAVLKSGRKMADLPAAGLSADDLAHLVMTGQFPNAQRKTQ